MRLRDIIGFVCIGAGIVVAVLGFREEDWVRVGSGVVLVLTGVVLIQSGRHDPDHTDAARTLMDDVDD